MTAVACSRSWQAEAMADGRLSPQDERAFKRHSAACHACQRELAILLALSDAGQRLPASEPTELDRRRARQELLRRANALAVSAHPSRMRAWAAVAAFAALAIAALVFLRPLSPPQPSLAVETPTYEVVAGEGTTWLTLQQGATLRLGLTRGHLEITVDKLRAGQRFLVQLPDGELEVRGTRFILDVEDASTRLVKVTEGAVALSLRGKPRLLLEPGDAYSPATQPPPAAPSSSPAKPENAGDAIATPPAASSPVIAPKSRVMRAAPSAAPSAEVEPAPARPASHPFNEAMAAFTAGDYGRAESLFRTFERENPSDGRVEDTTFLRAVARKRRGDDAGAEAAAREYLRKYPAGFRRLEAERLLMQR
jgi:ferric-dicitrate binding protein FerR (iron transport regulator)